MVNDIAPNTDDYSKTLSMRIYVSGFGRATRLDAPIKRHTGSGIFFEVGDGLRDLAYNQFIVEALEHHVSHVKATNENTKRAFLIAGCQRSFFSANARNALATAPGNSPWQRLRFVKNRILGSASKRKMCCVRITAPRGMMSKIQRSARIKINFSLTFDSGHLRNGSLR